jgi:hypothetical protein
MKIDYKTIVFALAGVSLAVAADKLTIAPADVTLIPKSLNSYGPAEKQVQFVVKLGADVVKPTDRRWKFLFLFGTVNKWWQKDPNLAFLPLQEDTTTRSPIRRLPSSPCGTTAIPTASVSASIW